MTDEVVLGDNTSASPAPTSAPTEVSEAPVTSVPGTQPAESSADPAASPARKVDGRVRRINELTYQLREAQRREEKYLETLQQAISRPAAHVAPQAAPRLDQFKDFNEFLDARDTWRDTQKQSKQSAAEPKAAPQTEAHPEFQAERQALLDEGSEKYEDFADVISNPSLKLSVPMAGFILESDTRAELAYFLGTNPKESARISSLPLMRQLAEMTRLEDKITAKAAAQVKRPSAAPAPVTPVTGASTSDAAPSTADDIGTWMKKRQRQVHGPRK